MTVISTQKYKGYKIEVIQDEEPFDPRENDNLGTMVCFHSRYTLGDKDHGYTRESLLEHLKNTNPVHLPLYLLDHSGITISTGTYACDPQGWDTSCVGVIFIDLEKARKEMGWKVVTPRRRERLMGILQAEVEEYDHYLRGDAYGFKVTDKDGDVIASVWGFLGDFEKSGLLNEARAEVDGDLKSNGEQLDLFPQAATA
jgi:hypothetical protein